MPAALMLLGGLALGLGAVLMVAGRVLRGSDEAVVDAIDAMLPQTQCGQCGYPGCRPYARAIAGDVADINQCPPGGQHTIAALADLLGRQPKPLDPDYGVEQPARIALIDESLCIGCKKCILACPVDAILGAPKLMHTVLTVECTGCDLCVPVCPVDCIDMVPRSSGLATWRPAAPRREPAAA